MHRVCGLGQLLVLSRPQPPHHMTQEVVQIPGVPPFSSAPSGLSLDLSPVQGCHRESGPDGVRPRGHLKESLKAPNSELKSLVIPPTRLHICFLEE